MDWFALSLAVISSSCLICSIAAGHEARKRLRKIDLIERLLLENLEEITVLLMEGDFHVKTPRTREARSEADLPSSTASTAA